VLEGGRPWRWEVVAGTMWLAHISFTEAGKALSPTERSYVLCKAEVADLRTRWRNTLAQHVTLFLEYRTYCGLRTSLHSIPR
jgi:hypothetical protein